MKVETQTLKHFNETGDTRLGLMGSQWVRGMNID